MSEYECYCPSETYMSSCHCNRCHMPRHETANHKQGFDEPLETAVSSDSVNYVLV